jgi:tyrosinase
MFFSGKAIKNAALIVSIATSFCGWVMPGMASNLVRKNVSELTSQEKSAFVKAVKTLKTTIPEGSTISIYDQFVVTHVETMGFLISDSEGPATGADAAHRNAAFLPWHREYLHRFEQALQSVDPTVTVPYWDWTDPTALDVIFNEDFLGLNGQETIEIPSLGVVQGGSVLSSPFSEASGWVLNPDIHINQFTGESLGTSLLRFLQVPPADKYPIAQSDIEQVLSLDNYLLFRPALEGEISIDEEGNVTPGFFIHNYIHGLVGGFVLDTTMNSPFLPLGTMTSHSSPYDPVFWLHHSNIDRLWTQWQENGHEGSNFYPSLDQPFGHNLNDPMWPWDGGVSTPGNMGSGDLLSLLPVLAPDDIITPQDTLDFRKYGYTYDTLSASVPEPTAILGLFALGLLGVGSALKGKQI